MIKSIFPRKVFLLWITLVTIACIGLIGTQAMAESISGTVMDEDSIPLSDFYMQVYHHEDDNWINTWTNADGYYEFDVYPGTWSVWVEEHGWYSVDPPEHEYVIDVQPGQNYPDNDFVMARDIDEPVIEHTPPEEATEGHDLVITATVYDEGLAGLMEVHIEFRGIGSPAHRENWWHWGGMEQIGGDTYEGVIPGWAIPIDGVQYRIGAGDWAHNWVSHPPEWSGYHEITNILPSPWHIYGTAVDTDMNPIEGARVWADGPEYTIETWTDETGCYQLAVKPGTWYVWAEKEGYSIELPGNSYEVGVTDPGNYGPYDFQMRQMVFLDLLLNGNEFSVGSQMDLDIHVVVPGDVTPITLQFSLWLNTPSGPPIYLYNDIPVPFTGAFDQTIDMLDISSPLLEEGWYEWCAKLEIAGITVAEDYEGWEFRLPCTDVDINGYTFTTNDWMEVWINFHNSTSEPLNVGVQIWLETPSAPVVIMDTVFTLWLEHTHMNLHGHVPEIEPGIYSWHVRLYDPATGTTIDDDEVEWEYVLPGGPMVAQDRALNLSKFVKEIKGSAEMKNR